MEIYQVDFLDSFLFCFVIVSSPIRWEKCLVFWSSDLLPLSTLPMLRCIKMHWTKRWAHTGTHTQKFNLQHCSKCQPSLSCASILFGKRKPHLGKTCSTEEIIMEHPIYMLTCQKDKKWGAFFFCFSILRAQIIFHKNVTPCKMIGVFYSKQIAITSWAGACRKDCFQWGSQSFLVHKFIIRRRSLI